MKRNGRRSRGGSGGGRRRLRHGRQRFQRRCRRRANRRPNRYGEFLGLGIKFLGDGRRLLRFLDVDPVRQGRPFEEFFLLFKALLNTRHDLGLLLRLLFVRSRVEASFAGIERVAMLLLEAGCTSVDGRLGRMDRIVEVMRQIGRVEGTRTDDRLVGRRYARRRRIVDTVNKLAFAGGRSGVGTPFGRSRKTRRRSGVVD